MPNEKKYITSRTKGRSITRGMSVILDPVKPTPNRKSLYDQQLEEIIDSGPVAGNIERKSLKQKAVKFCGSRVGLALISIVVFFFIINDHAA